MSRVNQPNRVSLRSDDDETSESSQFFSQFQINLNTPILNPETVDLVRATIPNAQINIPDYQLVFWYHKLATETTTPSASTLKCVRLYPSWWKEPDTILSNEYVRNEYYSDPSYLVSALNLATIQDLTLYNPFWVVSDVGFFYDSTTKRISFQGIDAGFFYCAAGYNDPFVIAAINGQTILMPMYNGDGTVATSIPQPLVPQYTLNLRMGFSMSGTGRGLNSFSNGSFLYANAQNWPEGNITPMLAESWPNLVYTSCVYMYTDIANGSSTTSENRQNLLAVIPVNSAPLGVTNYISAMDTILHQVSRTIQSIIIEMRDDANQPYTLPLNACVNVELYFRYAS